MLDESMRSETEAFVTKIKATDVYRTYLFQLERLKKNPELFEQVNNYRRMNFEMQNAAQVDDLFDKMDRFEKEYKEFRENAMVDDFLRAELALCRMMQDISTMIVAGLNFE